MADQLGHADPAFTLRVYAHTMRDEESDLSFAEFGGSKRLYPAPGIFGDDSQSSNPLKRLARREGSAREQSSLCESTAAKPAWGPVNARDSGDTMARREGFEPPTLRFEESSDDEE